MAVRPRNRHRAGFERLAQAIEHRALKLRQLVEKQHTQMREADLTRFRLQPAADQRSHRCAVMRRAERPHARHPPAFQRSRHAGNHRDFQRLRH